MERELLVVCDELECGKSERDERQDTPSERARGVGWAETINAGVATLDSMLGIQAYIQVLTGVFILSQYITKMKVDNYG